MGHRGPAEVVSAAIRGMSAAVLSASPVLIEPVFGLDITVPFVHIGKVHKTLSGRRGRVATQEAAPGDMEMHVLTGSIPVSESFGLTAELREKSHGQAFHSTEFSHWDAVPGDVYDGDSTSARVLASSRSRKNFGQCTPPKGTDLVDRL